MLHFCYEQPKKTICYLPDFRNGINGSIDGILFFRTTINSSICLVLFFRNSMNGSIDGILFFRTTINDTICPILFFRTTIRSSIYAIPNFLQGITTLFYPIPVLGNALKNVWGGIVFLENLRQLCGVQHLEAGTIAMAMLGVYK